MGFALGRAIVDPARGVAYVTLGVTDPSAPLGPPDAAPVLSAVSLEGRAARLSAGGYQVRPLASDELSLIRAALSHQDEWAESYVLPGDIAEPRARVTLGKGPQRQIIIDNPLANPSVPESLYRLVLSLERLRFEDGSWVPLAPAQVRVWLRAEPNATGAGEPAPVWLDLDVAAGAAGQLVRLDALGEADRRWLMTGDPNLQGRLVTLEDGTKQSLVWDVDWASWARG